jgi:soluble lytic murein transglycosylase-like protein
VSKTVEKKKFSSAKTRKSATKLSSKAAKKRVHASFGSRKARSLKKSQSTASALAIPAVSSASQGNVIALIKSMAPSHGVPTWFALRIAHVESNYKPHMRGAAGEYGVYQLKCATAKGIGFRGNCSQLLDARTNVQWGLTHLSIAIGKSGGNLRLAASKHNGGLGRRTEVASYVAKVF